MKKGTILFDDILTTIGEDAFKDCENLTSITLPKKVNGILANAFQNCVNLNEINYNGNSSDFKKIKFEANWNDNVPAEYAYCNDSKVRIKYNYLTFTALEDNCSIGFYNNPDSSVNPTVEYSFDKVNWNTLTDNVTIENGSKMYCRGLNPNGISGGYGEGGYNYFTGEGKFNVSGDIMSIIDYENTPETMVGTFYNLFGGNIDTSRDNFVDIVDASNLILSAKVLTADCYQRMFSACMSMVYGPQIKAEVLAPYCCWGMFINCTSLTTAPELPATTLADSCYAYMFGSCTSLTTAPELPAMMLTEGCYISMFWGCTSLNYIKCLATNISATDCITNWVEGVTSTGTFIKHPDMSNWTTGVNGIPEGWTVQDAS